MLFVKVHKEIREYDEKLMFKLSARQLIYGAIAIISGLLVYAVGVLVANLPASFVSYIVMFVSFPMFAFGFLKIHGMPFDRYFGIILKFYSHKQKIVYDNEYDPDVNTVKEDIDESISKRKRSKKRRKREKISEEDDS